MPTFNIPDSPEIYNYYVGDFLGVDYNDPMELDIRHSPHIENMIYKNGYLSKRHGLDVLATIGEGPINGIYHYSAPDDATHPNQWLVHSGTELYLCSEDFSEVQLQTGVTMANNKSTGTCLNGVLLILDGTTAWCYCKEGASYSVATYQSRAYVPLTVWRCKPNGAGILRMPTNIMSPFRYNTFIGDGESTEYILEAGRPINISSSSADTKVWVYDRENMTWGNPLTQGVDYTVDSNGKIIFTVAPEDFSEYNAENVCIRFKETTGQQYSWSNPINKCTIVNYIGTKSGGIDLVFAGNPDYSAMLMKSCSDYDRVLDAPMTNFSTEGIFYIPDDNYNVNVGNMPITGLLRLSDSTLGILKKQSDSDSSIYYAQSAIQTNAEYGVYRAALAITPGTKTIGCLTSHCCVNTLNYNLFLSEKGVFNTLTGEASATLERYATNKSYYIDKVLLKEQNLEEAIAVGCDNWYYLFLNNKCYVGDVTILTEPTHQTGQQFQWFLYTGLPNITAVERFDHDLYVGDTNGVVYTFNDRFVDQYIEDDEIKEKPVYCYFETRPLDFNYYYGGKTTKTLTINYVTNYDTKFDFGYKTIDDAKVITDTINTKVKEGTKGMPHSMQVKEKIRKFMFVTFYVESKYAKDCEFDRFAVTYTTQSKYRGV